MKKKTVLIVLFTKTLSIIILTLMISACSQSDADEDIESMKKEIDELKTSLDQKEAQIKENEINKSEEDDDDKNQSNNSEEEKNNAATIKKKKRDLGDYNQTTSLDIDLSTLHLTPNSVFNEPDSIINSYLDDEGNEYILDTNGSIYEATGYQYSNEVWEQFIRLYDQALVDYYMGVNQDVADYVTPHLMDMYKENKASGVFDYYHSNIQSVSVTPNGNETEVLITVEKNYGNKQGLGRVINEYIVTMKNKQIVDYQLIEHEDMGAAS